MSPVIAVLGCGRGRGVRILEHVTRHRHWIRQQ